MNCRTRLATLLIGVAVVILAFPLKMRSQVNAEQVMLIGRNVLSMEDYMLAIQYFNQAIKAKPYLSDPYFFRALAKLQLDDYKGAEADCTLAIERNNFKSEAYKVRGFARQQLGRDSLAILDYNVGLEYNPTDKYFLFYKAVAQTEVKDFDGADSTFTSLLRQYPRFEEGFAARGRLNLERKDTVAALADIDKSISLSRSQLNAWLLRADINAKRKQWTDAAADMDEAIRLRPDDADFYINRAYLRYNADDFIGAMSDYNYAIQLEPRNMAALFNRALLRYEVKDLVNAAKDFTNVLSLEPGNFHALYNRGLVYMESSQYAKALEDFKSIARKYPKFYPAYYAMAQCYQNMGNLPAAMRNVVAADQMVRQYVANPEKNPLDRPTIAAGRTNTSGYNKREDESEIEVMDRFNQLVTVEEVTETPLSYNEKIKGRVQDRNVQVEEEPMYAIVFTAPDATLQSLSNYFRELDDFNRRGFISDRLYLSPVRKTLNPEEIERLFNLVNVYTRRIDISKPPRPADLLARGVLYTSLKNYDAAISDFDAMIGITPESGLAYMGRAYAKYCKGLHLAETPADAEPVETPRKSDVVKSSGKVSPDAGRLLRQKEAMQAIAGAMNDYDTAISFDPSLTYAYFNKGNINYGMKDYTSAIECYSRAVAIDPSFGQAYFNRGLCYLQAGNKKAAFDDLSKAGELGVLPSYNILKRMK